MIEKYYPCLVESVVFNVSTLKSILLFFDYYSLSSATIICKNLIEIRNMKMEGFRAWKRSLLAVGYRHEQARLDSDSPWRNIGRSGLKYF